MMDDAIRERHRSRVAALTADPPAQLGDEVRWAGHYAADAVLVKPDGGVLRGLAEIARFLDDPLTRPVETDLLQAERAGAGGYAIAAYRTVGPTAQAGTTLTIYSGPPTAPVIGVQVYGPTLQPRSLDEWKECRSTIDRFDRLLVDVRKYGFTLLTGLLTAGAFAFVKLDTTPVPDAARVGISLVLMVLVLGLFTVDRYIEMLLRAAVTRARTLETALGLRLTHMLSSVAESVGTATWATWLYTLFVLSAIVPWVVSTATPWRSPLVIATTPGPARVVTILGLAFAVLLWIYHAWTRLGLRAGLGETTLRRAAAAALEEWKARLQAWKVRLGL
jgi:hypothetical protein